MQSQTRNTAEHLASLLRDGLFGTEHKRCGPWGFAVLLVGVTGSLGALLVRFEALCRVFAPAGE